MAVVVDLLNNDTRPAPPRKKGAVARISLFAQAGLDSRACACLRLAQTQKIVKENGLGHCLRGGGLPRTSRVMDRSTPPS